MNNATKNHQCAEIETSKCNVCRILPIIAAMVAASIIQPAFAVDRTWFGGTGEFGVNTNWSPAGVPGSGDRVIISSGNPTLSFNTSIAGLSFSGGILDGLGNLSINGGSTWTQGTVSGAATTTFNSTLNITGDGFKEVGNGRIVNAHDTTWGESSAVNGNILSIKGGTFNNTGTFTDANAFDDRMVNVGTFNNSGTYNKQNNTISDIQGGISFNNTGTVNVNAGTLRLSGDATHTGSFALSAGSTLNLSVGTHNFNGATIDGTGTFQISSGNVNLNGGNYATPFLFSGGTLSGTTTPIDGAVTWTDGIISGAAITTFNSTLDMTGDGFKEVGNGRIVNAHDTTWGGNSDINGNGNTLSIRGGTFNNTGTFTDTNAFDDRMVNVGTFNNSGTYNKQNNTISDIQGGISFNNTGTINVNAGVFNVAHAFSNAGTVNVSPGGTFRSSCGGLDCFVNAGVMQGNGTIQTPANNELVNSGAINPGDGIGHLAIDGGLNQTSDGVINFELASLSDFDQLAISGDVMLGGEISVWNLGYTPVIGDIFVVATFDERLANSTFAVVHTHGFGPGINFNVIYNEHDVTIAAIPEPEQYALLFAGLVLIGVVARHRLVADQGTPVSCT